jgi:arylsulfatase A-like enzyme
VRIVALAAILWLAGRVVASAAAPPVILVVMIDGARSDGAGCLDVGRYVAPAARRLCENGVAFGRAYAQSSWGAASIATVVTGVLPSVHGVNGGDDVLSADRPTAASMLADAGYVTAAFTTEQDVVDRKLLRGFAEHRFLSMHDIPEYRFDPAERMALSMLDWLDDHRHDLATKGALLLMHMVTGRLGYLAPPEYLRRFVPLADFERVAHVEEQADRFQLQFPPEDVAALVAGSDAGIALADGALGHVLAKLQAPDVASRTWIVLLSPYGEAHGEHGLVGHGITLYDETIRVPLVIVPPLGRGGRTRADVVVELADVMPTILEIAGVEAPANLRGRSLLAAVDGRRLDSREAVAELVRESPLRVHTRTVVDPGLHKSFQRQDGRSELYDLGRDGRERMNLR